MDQFGRIFLKITDVSLLSAEQTKNRLKRIFTTQITFQEVPMFKAKQHIVWRKKKKLIVLLNTKSGSYFTLNPTAQFLWMNHIVAGQPLDEVIQEISKKYANPPQEEQILADCQKLISDWKDSKLIEKKKQPSHSQS